MKKLIFLALLVCSLAAHAGQWGAQYHFLSNHFADRAYEDWSEDTSGFALRYSFDDRWALQAGHYKNEFSVRRYNFFTNYAGADYTPLAWGPLHVGGYGWVTSGYNDYALAPNPSGGAAQPSKVLWERDSGIHPAVGLVLRLDVGRFNLLVRLHPDLPGGVPAAVMTEVGVAL